MATLWRPVNSALRPSSASDKTFGAHLAGGNPSGGCCCRCNIAYLISRRLQLELELPSRPSELGRAPKRGPSGRARIRIMMARQVSSNHYRARFHPSNFWTRNEKRQLWAPLCDFIATRSVAVLRPADSLTSSISIAAGRRGSLATLRICMSQLDSISALADLRRRAV